jgi:hypothetical protein
MAEINIDSFVFNGVFYIFCYPVEFPMQELYCHARPAILWQVIND